jgi:hypothetical protein
MLQSIQTECSEDKMNLLMTLGSARQVEQFFIHIYHQANWIIGANAEN